MLSRPYHHWRLITKVFIIANALVWALLMAFVPNSLTYMVAHSHNAGSVPTVILFAGIVVLVVDLLLHDWLQNGRRRWCFENLMPMVYMAMGGGYLVFAFLCSFVDSAEILLFNALVQAAMAGWTAVLEKRDLSAS
jgi:hypothetical protein